MDVKSFEDLKIPRLLQNQLMRSYPDITLPTEVQKKMLALLKSDVSVLVRSDPATGKSLAAALYVLSLSPIANATADKAASIASLIVVPTSELGAQYYAMFERLVDSSKVNIHKVVQRLYRTDASSEISDKHQMDLLTKYPAPRILIATPSRLLDYCSSPKRHLVPLFNLASVVVDELDVLYSHQLIEAQGTSVKSKKRPPTDLLMEHIRVWRDGVTRGDAATPPLRLLLMSSVDSSKLSEFSDSKKWTQSDRPMLTIGTGSGLSGSYYRLPEKAANYFLDYDPTSGNLSDTKLSNNGPPNDQLDMVQAATKSMSASSLQKRDDYCAGLIKFLQRTRPKALTNDDEHRGLVLIPDGMSAAGVAERLQEIGLNVGINSSKSPTGFMALKEETLDPHSAFRSIDILVSKAINVQGLNFPELNSVYVFDWASIFPKYSYGKIVRLCRPYDKESTIVVFNTPTESHGELPSTREFTMNHELGSVDRLVRKHIEQ